MKFAYLMPRKLEKVIQPITKQKFAVCSPSGGLMLHMKTPLARWALRGVGVHEPRAQELDLTGFYVSARLWSKSRSVVLGLDASPRAGATTAMLLLLVLPDPLTSWIHTGNGWSCWLSRIWLSTTGMHLGRGRAARSCSWSGSTFWPTHPS